MVLKNKIKVDIKNGKRNRRNVKKFYKIKIF